MALWTVRLFLFAAAIMNGILVGGGTDRALIGFPAWQVVGPQAWATFSRQADLGNGRLWYPLWAFAGMLCSAMAAVLLLYWSVPASLTARLCVYAAAVLTIGGLLLTIKAAPIMLGLRRIGDDPGLLQHAFEGFTYWSYWRLACQFLGWLAILCALLTLSDVQAGTALMTP